jgi:hypothetical protein
MHLETPSPGPGDNKTNGQANAKDAKGTKTLKKTLAGAFFRLALSPAALYGAGLFICSSSTMGLIWGGTMRGLFGYMVKVFFSPWDTSMPVEERSKDYARRAWFSRMLLERDFTLPLLAS